MKPQLVFAIIISLVLSGCFSIPKKNSTALVITPIELPYTPEKEESWSFPLYNYISLCAYLKNKGFKVEVISENPLIYKIPAQEGLLEDLAKILKTVRVITGYYTVNLANINTTKTSEGGPYRRKGLIINKNFEIKKVIDIPGDLKKVFDPSHPDADSDGYLWLPNVDRKEETTEIMSMKKLEKAIIRVIEKLDNNSVALSSGDYYKLYISD